MLINENRNKHCCLCGQTRKPTQQPLESFGKLLSVRVADHRPLQTGRWEADGGELLVRVGLWRNGGTSPGETHTCDDCVIMGLRAAKEFVDSALADFGQNGA